MPYVFPPGKLFLDIMNPVRQRIFQYFLLHETGTVKELKKDLLLLTNCTLLLTDEEFLKFLSEINEVALKYMKVEATESSKTREITLISSPVDL